jgi:hypothetical protein
LYDVKQKPQLELCASMAVRFLIANDCTRCPCNFKGLSQDGRRAKFAENILSSPYNADLSIDTNFFSLIHLEGQYL